MLNKISIAIIIHLMIGIYSYGSPSLFPNEVGIFIASSFQESPTLSLNSDSFIMEILKRVF